MLILTRRIGESVYIGDEVRLTVLGVRGTQVRIGINAPKDIPVHREEIYHKIKHEQSGGRAPTHPNGNASNVGNVGNSGGNGNSYANADYDNEPSGNVNGNGNDSGNFDDSQSPSPEEADPHNS